jgi:hypothetical protein
MFINNFIRVSHQRSALISSHSQYSRGVNEMMSPDFQNRTTKGKKIGVGQYFDKDYISLEILSKEMMVKYSVYDFLFEF